MRFPIRLMVVLAALALVLSLFTSPASAQYDGHQGPQPGVRSGGGGFTGPGPAVVTVKQALTFSDDTAVTLVGNIVQHLGSDNYVFRDKTGTINVDIDQYKWNGQTVGPGDTVELAGEIDRDWGSVEVDVSTVRKIAR